MDQSSERQFSSIARNKQQQTLTATGTKILQLNDRLMSLDSVSEPLTKTNYDTRLKKMEEMADRQAAQEDSCFAELKQDMLRVGSLLSDHKTAMEDVEIGSLRELKQLEADIVREQLKFKTQCKEKDMRMLQAFEESSINLKHEWKQTLKWRQETQIQHRRQMETQVAHLEQAITFEVKMREQKNDSIINNLSSALNYASSSLNQERRKREQNHLAMLRSLEQLNAELSQELKQEQATRDRADQLLYRLLEDTCTKVEGYILKRRVY